MPTSFDNREEQATVPYFVHEGQMARMERITKRLSITIVAVLAVALVMFVINNIIWLRYVERQRAEIPVEASNAGVYEQSDSSAD